VALHQGLLQENQIWLPASSNNLRCLGLGIKNTRLGLDFIENIFRDRALNNNKKKSTQLKVGTRTPPYTKQQAVKNIIF